MAGRSKFLSQILTKTIGLEKSRREGGRNRLPGGIFKFLVAVPVKTFDLGDNNWDLHMQEVTKTGLFPLIKVNVEISKMTGQKAPQKLIAEVDVEFAGKKTKYPKMAIDILEWKSGEVHLQVQLILSLKAFGITSPSLLTMPVQDGVPVKVDMVWKKVDLEPGRNSNSR